MDYSTYVVNTFSVSLSKILPVLITLAVGYFVFIKLPFFVFLKVLKDSKAPSTDFLQGAPQSYEDQEAKAKQNAEIQRLKELEKIRLNKSYTYVHRERKKEEKKHEEKQEEKKEEKAPPKKESKSAPSAENVFSFAPGSTFTKSELKKRYHELLKASHPDLVGPDLKSMAERKTKEINSAYQKLKNRAA